MAQTDFDDLVTTRERETASTEEQSTAYQVIGSAISITEVQARLSAQLYAQLRDGSDGNVTAAIGRAIIHCGAVAAKAGKVFNLDDTVMREIALELTVVELHAGLGHAEEGKEHRLKAKDLIAATFGPYPEAGADSGSRPPLGAVTTEKRKSYP